MCAGHLFCVHYLGSFVACICRRHATMYVRRSESNLLESFLSFQYRSSGDHTQVIRLAWKCLCPLSRLLALLWMVQCKKHRSQPVWLRRSMHSSQKYLVIGGTIKMARKPASKLSSQETHPKPSEEATAPLARRKQNSNCEVCSILSQLLNHPNHSHLFWRQQRLRQLLYCLHEKQRKHNWICFIFISSQVKIQHRQTDWQKWNHMFVP